MPKILFWNVGRKSLDELVCSLVEATSADAVVLIESGSTAADLLASLRRSVSTDFSVPESTHGRFFLATRNANLDLSETYYSDRLSIRRLVVRDQSLSLGLVHLVDKRNWDASPQLAEAILVANNVRRRERHVRHRRTIVMGDFNLNPFDEAMNIAHGFNAMSTRKCVAARKRKVNHRRFPYFYNPMWSLFGDQSVGPAGTYYHSSPSKGIHGWNMLDQVLVRPDALDYFEDVKIVDSAGSHSLKTDAERPRRTFASDHFPLLLTVK